MKILKILCVLFIQCQTREHQMIKGLFTDFCYGDMESRKEENGLLNANKF